MITTVNGEIFHVSATTEAQIYAAANAFFTEAHDNDLLAVDDFVDEPIYISKKDVELGRIDEDCFVHFSHRMFKDARRNKHLIDGGVVPALNELGDPVCLLKRVDNLGYVHFYEKVNGAPDTRVFELYKDIVLIGVTEYAFILLRDALVDFQGRIFCVGEDWIDFERLIPGRDNVTYIADGELPKDLVKGETMYIHQFDSFMAGYRERCAEGNFSYDEIMALVYFFSIFKSYGSEHEDKNFFLLNPVFPMEGLMSICDKLGDPYAYVKASGFIPVIRLTNSDGSMYSDYDGEDIWSKFFKQPYGAEADEWKNAAYVWESPYCVITFSDRWPMKRIVQCEEISLMNTNYINDRVKAEIDKQRETALPHPEKTIGLLIRGTDYTATHLPGHGIMATPEQVMEKVKELEASGEYGEIYLATEDEDVLQKMKELCGDRLHYIDQKRFRINPGELLAYQKKERENEGWLKGKEYLTTLQFLSECRAFVASGGCCGTACVINTGGDNFKETYVFNLGRY